MKFDRVFENDEQRIETIAEYFPVIRKIQDKELAAKTARVWIRVLEECQWEDLEDVVFGVKYPEQNLANHIRVTTEGSYEVARLMNQYQGMELDLDVVITLGLLHDVSKCLEFEPDGQGGGRYSEMGEKVQHGFYGAMYAIEEGFSWDFINLIISHTPQSNTQPVNREGILFAFLDLVDADMVAYPHKDPLFYHRLH